jgi:hypothetical protein
MAIRGAHSGLQDSAGGPLVTEPPKATPSHRRYSVPAVGLLSGHGRPPSARERTPWRRCIPVARSLPHRGRPGLPEGHPSVGRRKHQACPRKPPRANLDHAAGCFQFHLTYVASVQTAVETWVPWVRLSQLPGQSKTTPWPKQCPRWWSTAEPKEGDAKDLQEGDIIKDPGSKENTEGPDLNGNDKNLRNETQQILMPRRIEGNAGNLIKPL